MNLLAFANLASREVFLQSLDIMWKGMLSIFVVLGIISLIVILMGKIEKWLNRKNRKDEE